MDDDERQDHINDMYEHELRQEMAQRIDNLKAQLDTAAMQRDEWERVARTTNQERDRIAHELSVVRTDLTLTIRSLHAITLELGKYSGADD